MLSSHGLTPTLMETLVLKLKNKKKIKAASNKKNVVVRFFHMNYIFWKHFNSVELIFIDIFSTKAFFFGFFFGFFSWILRIPYIPILRGGDLPYRIKKSPGLSQFLFRKSANNVTPSLFIKSRFAQNNYRTKYIPNFIEFDHYPFQQRKSSRPKLLWVRAFHEIYNPKMAVFVLCDLLKGNPNAGLTMVGPDKDGSQKLCMDLADDLGIAKQITFTGLLPKKEWISLAEKSDIFINTTHVDNMPVSIIEAMALGFPIVSTDVGGIPFLLEDGQNALFVGDNDTVGMVEKINILLRDNHLSMRLSRNARITAQQYGWDAVYPKWKKVIDKYSKP